MKLMISGALLALTLPLTAGCTSHSSDQKTRVVVVNADENLLKTGGSGEITWNGETITLTQLDGLLAQAVAMEPEPALRFEPDPAAGYEIATAILQRIRVSGVTRLGFTGNEKAPNGADPD
ncbi:MAG: biopolymer transporter ExbD [Pseudomonadota bacterium]